MVFLASHPVRSSASSRTTIEDTTRARGGATASIRWLRCVDASATAAWPIHRESLRWVESRAQAGRAGTARGLYRNDRWESTPWPNRTSNQPTSNHPRPRARGPNRTPRRRDGRGDQRRARQGDGPDRRRAADGRRLAQAPVGRRARGRAGGRAERLRPQELRSPIAATPAVRARARSARRAGPGGPSGRADRQGHRRPRQVAVRRARRQERGRPPDRAARRRRDPRARFHHRGRRRAIRPR